MLVRQVSQRVSKAYHNALLHQEHSLGTRQVISANPMLKYSTLRPLQLASEDLELQVTLWLSRMALNMIHG